MESPSPVLAILWGGLCYLSLLQMGSMIGKQSTLMDRLVTGWLASMLLSFLALVGGVTGMGLMVVLTWVLAFWWLRKSLRHLRMVGWIRLKFQIGSVCEEGRILWTMAVILLGVRMVLALLPIQNWDSLNHHLPLLLSRMQEGGWDPMVWVSTERRTPLFSILPKVQALCLDPTGRALVIQHLLLGVGMLFAISRTLEHRWGRGIWTIPVLMMWSLSDAWRHILTAGDEIWMVIGLMAFVSMLLEKGNLKRRSVLAGMALVGCFGIKATAIFFIVPFSLAYVFHLRKWPKLVVTGILSGATLALLAMSMNLWHYSMAYPANRWSDLLAESSPTVYGGTEVKEQREALGLLDHRDNHSPGTKALSSLMDNLGRLPELGLGPYLLWLLGAVLLLGRRQLKGCHREGALLGLSLLSAVVAMLVWKFSPQALFRYLLPVWWVLILSTGVLLTVILQEDKRWLRWGLGLMLFFAVGLEGREVVRMSQHSHAWEPVRYWLEVTHDGPLISAWREERSGKDRAFYIGSLSVLMVDEQRHWLAQLGNEVGWRAPKGLSVFLKREGIDWWILSAQADRLDPMYRKLTDVLVSSGVLEKTRSLESGEIYRVGRVSD